MKDIFSELYNKVLGFFRQTERKEETETAKDVACNRLKVVLMQDRTNLSPELMNRMRKELVELLSKYVEMDKEALELGFEQEGTQMALMLSIPVVRAKDEAEIEEILAKEDAEKAKLEGSDNDIKSESDDSEEVSEDSDSEISDDEASIIEDSDSDVKSSEESSSITDDESIEIEDESSIAIEAEDEDEEENEVELVVASTSKSSKKRK